MSDPKSALEIFKKRVPEIDLAVIEPNLLMGLELMKTDRYAQHGIGWMDEQKMCASVELVNMYMSPPKKAECRQVYTNEFLTRVEIPKVMR
jgi:NitT/TauT family transport system substrate-binding protein